MSYRIFFISIRFYFLEVSSGPNFIYLNFNLIPIPDELSLHMKEMLYVLLLFRQEQCYWWKNMCSLFLWNQFPILFCKLNFFWYNLFVALDFITLSSYIITTKMSKLKVVMFIFLNCKINVLIKLLLYGMRR